MEINLDGNRLAVTHIDGIPIWEPHTEDECLDKIDEVTSQTAYRIAQEWAEKYPMIELTWERVCAMASWGMAEYQPMAKWDEGGTSECPDWVEVTCPECYSTPKTRYNVFWDAYHIAETALHERLRDQLTGWNNAHNGVYSLGARVIGQFAPNCPWRKS